MLAGGARGGRSFRAERYFPWGGLISSTLTSHCAGGPGDWVIWAANSPHTAYGSGSRHLPGHPLACRLHQLVRRCGQACPRTVGEAGNMPAHRKIPGRRSVLASVAGLAVILGGGTALVLTS